MHDGEINDNTSDNEQDVGNQIDSVESSISSSVASDISTIRSGTINQKDDKIRNASDGDDEMKEAELEEESHEICASYTPCAATRYNQRSCTTNTRGCS